MKKLFIFLTLFLVSVSLFSQERVSSKDNKNVIRIQTETIFVNYYPTSWGNGECDYALNGLGISYSHLFNDNFGMTIVFGTLAFGVEDPFNNPKIDFNNPKQFPFDIYRYGLSLRLGPYFRIGRIGINPALNFAFTVPIYAAEKAGDLGYWEFDYVNGITLGVDFLITDSFLIFVDGGLQVGTRYSPESLVIFREAWEHNYDPFKYLTLFSASLTIGVGFIF